MDTVRTGTPITFKLRYTNGAGANLNISNGYEIYSPDGATWSGPVVGDTLTGAIPRSNWDLGFAMNVFPGTGGYDTVGIIGAKLSAIGLPTGFNGVPYGLRIGSFDDAESGLHVCVDSAWFRPGGTWKWVGTGGLNVYPTWGGPYCYTVYTAPPIPVQITNCVTSLLGSHCSTFTYDFDAIDAEGDPITFQLVSGPGTINANTGVWTWTNATLADVGASRTIVVEACDPFGCGQPCTININVTNEAPVLLSPVCGTSTLISLGQTETIDVNATDACNDPLTYSIASVTPSFSGTISINPTSGIITATPQILDAVYTVAVAVTDGNLSDTCQLEIEAVSGCPFGLQISKEHNVPQGGYWSVPVTLTKGDATEGLGGFDILIAYDNSVLSFQNASLGAAFGPSGCRWEYFTYRFGADGNCGGGCPSGLVHVFGIAESNNGANHPLCTLPATLPATLFNLNFLVSNDRTLECQSVPIRFYWLTCTDNVLSNAAGDEAYMSCTVAEAESPLINIANSSVGFPTYLGAQDACFTGGGPGKPTPITAIDFINGGIDIVCADSIDIRGDINLNGLAYEIADAVNLTNYFVKGLGAFTINVNGQIAASDVNADGISLSVADLVYLVRVIVGDANPYPKINPVAVNYAVNNGVISVDGEMGGAFVVLEGNVAISDNDLLSHGMTMKSEFDGVNTRVIIYPPFEGVSRTAGFTGDFLNVRDANIVSLELATIDGAPVTLKSAELPTRFELHQNYPNPFNPSTTISFSLPVASAWTLKIYNVAGQEVTSFTGDDAAGEKTVTVEASGWASGVYFFTLDVGSFSETRKMLLIK
ncbi:MAG: T9SS type A sorting domain-containing protein [Candidatus Zixiibacteriota bacterium]